MRVKPKIIGSIAGRLDSERVRIDRCNFLESIPAAADIALTLAKEGADILDITPPVYDSRLLTQHEEAEYVTLLLKELKEKRVSLPLALQTAYSVVAQDAIALGVSFLCDKTGAGDEAMYEASRTAGCYVCISYRPHARDIGQEAWQRSAGSDSDFVEKLVTWFEMQMKTLLHAGIEEQKIVIDLVMDAPMNIDINMLIINNIDKFQALGLKVLVDLSGSHFIERLLHRDKKELLAAEIAVDVLLQLQDVDYIRVSNVKAHYDALHVVRSLHKSK